MYKQILTVLILIISETLTFACTLGVANGSSTIDGRPLLWKTRDYEVKPNIIHYTETDKYNFVSNITPEYGFDKSWFGLNVKGFAIANTYITDYPEGESGLGNGELMNLSLSQCATVNDFRNLLDSTNSTGRTTRAVFGVIDSAGGASIFEVNANTYWEYNANDKETAPDGYLIRTNFVKSAKGERGIERYHRSTHLISDMTQNSNLSVKNVLQTQMRDINSSLQDQHHFSDSLFNCQKNICKYYSISACVVQGVKNEEPAYLSTMWAMLGNPFTSITVPYWPVGPTPLISSSSSNYSLYGTSEYLKRYIFDSFGNRNLVKLNEIGELSESLFEAEDSIFKSTNIFLNKWRTSKPPFGEILEIENHKANYAFTKLNALCSKKPDYKEKRIIILDSFPDKDLHNGRRKISIEYPPGYFKTRERYRVIYFFDGETYFSTSPTDKADPKIMVHHDGLLENDLIFPALFVGIHNNGNRFSELTPTKGKCNSPGGDLEKLYLFISRVLKPYIDSNFRTLPSGEHTGIAGHSLGGLAAAYICHTYPGSFGMAGCMSPSFWWDDKFMLQKFASFYTEKKPRFWIMSADLEYPELWQDAHKASKILLDQGWSEGDNLAYYHVYGGGHNTLASEEQMRNMLYFLLRKKSPVLMDSQIKTVLNTSDKYIDIEQFGENTKALLELNFTNGYRTNAIAPSISIEDESIAYVDDNIAGVILPLTDGKTKLFMKNGEQVASTTILSYDYSDYCKYPVKFAEKAISIDGVIKEWGKLKFESMTDKDHSSGKFLFDVKQDEKYIYLAIESYDDTVLNTSGPNCHNCDRIIVHFDARPDPYRSLGRGLKEWNAFLPIEISPGKTDNSKTLMRNTFYGNALPGFLQAKSIKSKKGYSTEIRIPIKYIIEQQGKEWIAFRLNIYQHDLDKSSGERIVRSWQPAWNSVQNINASGTFSRDMVRRDPNE